MRRSSRVAAQHRGGSIPGDLVQPLRRHAEQGAEVLKFFSWAYKNGGKLAEELDYVALPDSLVKVIEASWGTIKDSSGKLVYAK